MNPFKLINEPGNRLPALVILLLIVLLPGYAWHTDTSGFLTDDGMYLMLADFFSPYREGNVLVEHFIASRSRFPPAFPVLIGLLGGGSRSMPVAHLVTAACFVLSSLAFFVWARTTLHAAHLAAASLLSYVLLPESLFFVLEIRSEFLYLALVFTAFVLLHRASESEQRRREVLLAAAFVISLCILTRTIGVALFGAFVLYLYGNRINNKSLYISVVACLPIAWLAIKEISGYSGNYTEDLYRYLEPQGIARLLTNDIPRNALLMLQAWPKQLAITPGSPWIVQTLSFALLALGVVGAIERTARKCVDAHYLIVYLLLVIVWPHPFHIPRLIYPLIPLMLVYGFIGARIVLSVASKRLTSWAHIVIVFAILVLIYPKALSIIERYVAPLPGHIPEDFRHTRTWLNTADIDGAQRNVETKKTVIELLKRTQNHMRMHECMYAVHPVSAILYADRLAIMVPPDPSMENLTSCEYLFVMNLVGEFKAKYPLESVDRKRLTLVDIAYDSRGLQQAYLFKIKR
ncbi:MAG: hypothetical protein MAG794_01267 [Gammaproteobacteria bacterium]|nr:hypothetical protein [Gammaproteobacteria bacterium]